MPWQLHLLLAFATGVLATQTTAAAVLFPSLPASFYGRVTVGGGDVQTGEQISARIDDVMYAETQTFLFDGRSVYAIDVPGDDPATPEIEGGRPGDTIVFYVSELQADQTALWHGGTNTELDLTATSLTVSVFLPVVLR